MTMKTILEIPIHGGGRLLKKEGKENKKKVIIRQYIDASGKVENLRDEEFNILLKRAQIRDVPSSGLDSNISAKVDGIKNNKMHIKNLRQMMDDQYIGDLIPYYWSAENSSEPAPHPIGPYYTSVESQQAYRARTNNVMPVPKFPSDSINTLKRLVGSNFSGGGLIDEMQNTVKANYEGTMNTTCPPPGYDPAIMMRTQSYVSPYTGINECITVNEATAIDKSKNYLALNPDYCNTESKYVRRLQSDQLLLFHNAIKNDICSELRKSLIIAIKGSIPVGNQSFVHFDRTTFRNSAKQLFDFTNGVGNKYISGVTTLISNIITKKLADNKFIAKFKKDHNIDLDTNFIRNRYDHVINMMLDKDVGIALNFSTDKNSVLANFVLSVTAAIETAMMSRTSAEMGNLDKIIREFIETGTQNDPIAIAIRDTYDLLNHAFESVNARLTTSTDPYAIEPYFVKTVTALNNLEVYDCRRPVMFGRRSCDAPEELVVLPSGEGICVVPNHATADYGKTGLVHSLISEQGDEFAKSYGQAYSLFNVMKLDSERIERLRMLYANNQTASSFSTMLNIGAKNLQNDPIMSGYLKRLPGLLTSKYGSKPALHALFQVGRDQGILTDEKILDYLGEH